MLSSASSKIPKCPVLFPCCHFVVFPMCYLFNYSSRIGIGVTASHAPVSSCDQSMWLPMPNPFSEIQVGALRLCLLWSDSCLKSVSGENHFLFLNRTEERKLLPCSQCQWWSSLVDLDTVVCFTDYSSRKPNPCFIHVLITAAFHILREIWAATVFYSWCFGIF